MLKGVPPSSNKDRKVYEESKAMVRRKYSILKDTDTDTSVLVTRFKSTSLLIVAYEDLFNILYDTCIEHNHVLQKVQDTLTSTYGNIPNTLIKWFQDNACAGCFNTRKHGNCKKKNILLPTASSSSNNNIDVRDISVSSRTETQRFRVSTVTTENDNVLPCELEAANEFSVTDITETKCFRVSALPLSEDMVVQSEIKEQYDTTQDDFMLYKWENLFGTDLLPKKLRNLSSYKSSTTRWSKKLHDLSFTNGTIVQLDNSRPAIFQGCWLNSSCRLLFHMFKIDDWKKMIHLCVTFKEEKSQTAVPTNEENNCSKASAEEDTEDVEQEESMRSEVEKQKKLEILNKKTKNLGKEIIINFMDLLYRGFLMKKKLQQSCTTISHVSTFPFAKKLLAHSPGLYRGKLKEQHDPFEFIAQFAEIMEDFDKSIFDTMRPEIMNHVKCSSCGDEREKGFEKQDSFLVYFGSSSYVKRWEELVELEKNNNNPSYFNVLKNTHATTYVDISVQEILDNMKISLYDNEGICEKYADGTPFHAEENEDPFDPSSSKFPKQPVTDDLCQVRRNDVSGLSCSDQKCAKANFMYELRMKTVKTTIMVSAHNIVTWFMNDGTKQLLPKFWPMDMNATGNVEFNEKLLQMHVTSIIFKNSSHNSKTGHYISCVRMKSNVKDIPDEWRMYDDAIVRSGLPDKNSFYPVLYTFETV